MRYALILTGLVAAVGIGAWAAYAADQAEGGDEAAAKTDAPPVLNFKMKRLNGEEAHLGKYHGNVILMVNTASKCSLTPQYKQLQELHKKYAEQGLSVIGFPANNFGKQEPGTNKQIATFCKEDFGVEFDMFAKISVKGEDQCKLYKFLTEKETNGEFAGPIKWNFTKFLINREGKVIARFEPRVKPDAKPVIEAIEKALAEPRPEGLEEAAEE